MALPTFEEALARIRELAEEEQLEVCRKAQTEMDGLGYTEVDVCDMLWKLDDHECEKIDWSHREPRRPVATFVTEFCSDARAARDLPADRLFVEVMIREDSLYLLACKQDGSPQ